MTKTQKPNPLKNALKNSKPNSIFQKVWYLKFNDPSTQKALWLRFNLLSSRNGFNRVAETWAVYFEKNSKNREIKKVALRQRHEMTTASSQDLASEQNTTIRIGECELSTQLAQGHTKGSVQSKGNSIEWDLTFITGRKSSFQSIPKFFARTNLVKNSITTPNEELFFSGTTTVNGEVTHWKDALGMLGFMQGSQSGDSWIWGHCNTFVNPQGKPVPFVFEGLSMKAKLGPLVTPALPSFYFSYQDQDYTFNSLRDSLQIRSKSTLNEWEFRVDRGELSFRGQIQATHKDFVGLTFEDTNGSLLYCANSKLADMKIFVYRKGKLETTLTADGTAAFEIVSRDKNPYVPLLI